VETLKMPISSCNLKCVQKFSKCFKSFGLSKRILKQKSGKALEKEKVF
jgi:hypothetical protein